MTTFATHPPSGGLTGSPRGAPSDNPEDQFLAEMAKIRQDQQSEGGAVQQNAHETNSNPTSGKYKQRLTEARRESDEDDGYKYPGYKARRRASLDEDEPPVVSSSAPSPSGGDVFAQVRTRRQEDLLKAARTRKKTKEKKKRFGDQIKGVLAYLPFGTSHLSGFDN